MDDFTEGVRNFFGVQPAKRKKWIKRRLDDIPDTPSYPGLKPGTADDFANLRKFIDLNNQTNIPKKSMPVASRPRLTKTRGRKAPRSRPTMRKSTKKRKLKRKAPRGAKRTSKKRKVSVTKYHNHRYEQEGTCNSTQPYMYVGINDCHKRDAIWDAMADALLRPILAKECKFIPLQDTDKIGDLVDGSKKTIVFDFKRVKATAGAELIWAGLDNNVNLAASRVDLDDTTYETMRTRMSSVLRNYADGLDYIRPDLDTVAFFPYRYHMCGKDSSETSAATMSASVITSFDHVGDTMIDLSFAQKTVFVNRTLAEGGGSDGQFTDRLGTNPLKGKVYQFNHSSPRVLDHVDMSAALRTSIQSDSSTGMTRYQSTDILDTHLAHPLAAKFWLKNCVKESNFILKPGGYMSHATTKSIKGKLSTLIERFYFSGFDKGTFGQSSLIMFDMVNHTSTSQLPTTTYKRSCVVKSAGKLQTPKLYIPDFEASVVTV